MAPHLPSIAACVKVMADANRLVGKDLAKV
jgi:hypothetical protein